MTRVLIDIPSDKSLDQILEYLKQQGVSNPLVIDENAEDKYLSNLMDESDRSKIVSLDSLQSLRD